MELGKRKEMILAAIVEQYIKTGEPIGSKFLMTALPISVSSATIRNEMNALAEMGYLDQPHTSAGRVPSQKGYRYYIDHLMNKCELDEDEREMVREELERCAGNPEKLLSIGARNLGMNTVEVPRNNQRMREAVMEKGCSVICMLKSQELSQFVVITKIDDDGNFVIKDPSSKNRSKKGYSFTDLKNNGLKRVWKYSPVVRTEDASSASAPQS